MSTENDTDSGADALFEAAMAQEAERPDLAPPPAEEDDISPGEMLEATVESAKAERAVKGEPEKTTEKLAAEPIKFTAEEYLQTRERAQKLEAELAEVRKQGDKAKDEATAKAGLFEDPEGWEAQQQAKIDERVAAVEARLRGQALEYDLAQTRSRIGDEKYAAIDKAVTDAAARDPAFAKQLRELSPYGAGAAIEKWYDQNEAVLNPAAYEARLREKILAEMNGENAPDGRPAGQKPATGADAAGENVVRLPKSLSRQAAARAATSDDDGDDSEAAIFAAGANKRG
jgi:hypothetical protein